MGSARKGVGIWDPRTSPGKVGSPNSPLFVSKLFRTKVTLKTQLFSKCGQVSIASGSSMLAQTCCGPSAG